MRTKSLIFSALILCFTACEPLEDNATWEEGGPRVRGWNNHFSQDTKDELENGDYVPHRGHQWITQRALDYLKNRGLLPESIEDNEYHLYYGTWFADNPWAGRPEDIDACHTSVIRSDEQGKVFDEDRQQVCGESNAAQLRSKYEGRCIGSEDTWYDDNNYQSRPNPYLEAQLYINIEGKYFEDRPFLDNFYHFPNGENPDKDKVTFPKNKFVDEVDGTHGNAIFENSEVGAPMYSGELFKLARNFSESNSRLPRLWNLKKVGPSVGLPNGNLCGDLTDSALGWKFELFCDFDKMTSKIPHTYFGGNPFICTSDGSDKDTCKNGKPTWPVFVPRRNDKVNCHMNSMPCFERAQKARAEFKEALSATRPEKQDRVSAIYLGWALHMLQDLAVPVHVGNYTGKSHKEQEDFGDDQTSEISQSEIDAKLDASFSSKNAGRICGRHNLSYRTLNIEEKMRTIAKEIMWQVHPKVEAAFDPAVRELIIKDQLVRAVEASALAIMCLNGGEKDTDGDHVLDPEDNCPFDYNPKYYNSLTRRLTQSNVCYKDKMEPYLVSNHNFCLDYWGSDYDSKHGGGKVSVHPCHGRDNQKFYYDPATKLAKSKNGLCLDVWGPDYNRRNNGGKISMHPCHGGDNQKFHYNRDTHQLISLNGLCVDIHRGDYNENVADGRLVMWDCHGGPNQKWNSREAGTECGSEKVYDCVLECVGKEKAERWKTDSYCDEGKWGMNLHCPAFGNDNGECD